MGQRGRREKSLGGEVILPRSLLFYTGLMSDEAITGVLALAEKWGLPVPQERAERIASYLSLLLTWNARVNLTGARGIRELLGDHLPDSFALAKMCPRDSSVVDIGSGAGLPAIPFGILRPDCCVTLVEPRAKRIAFLNMAARNCELRGGAVLRKRVEELTDSRYSVACSRATFSPDAWLVAAHRLLISDGLAVVFTTSRDVVSPPSARIVDSVEYSTGAGSPRWCACYCFT